MNKTIGEQAGTFAIIGGVGFVIDGGILTALNSVFGVDLLYARLASYSVAVTVTWYLNRHRTFSKNKDANAVSEWSRYAVINGIGALLNMGIFFWLVHRFSTLANTPLLPLAIAASVALIFNFFATRHIVFRHQQT